MFGLSEKEREDKARKERERLIAHRRDERDEGDLITSVAVGMATDSALLGYAVGGSLIGGMLGQSIADTARATIDTLPSIDTPSSCDTTSSSNSSFDTGCSSFDSGSSGSFDSGSSSF